MGNFRLRVLGGFALEASSGTAGPHLPKRRAEAVLAVLAVCGDLGCTRERLLSLLWPENDEASARHGLRDALHAIRRALGPDAVPSGGRLLRLDSAVVISDALLFAQALSSGRPADAVRLYAGPLLDGFHADDAAEFEHWLDGERTRLAREYVEALQQLATAAERVGVWNDAVGWWARAVEHDPLNSHLVLQQVRVLAAIGDRANAIKVAEGHARRLREEFELEPDREILATIERIRRGNLPALKGGVPPFTSAPLEERRQTAEEPPQPIEAPAMPSEGGQAPRTAITAAVKQTPRWVPWAVGVTAAAIVLGAALGAGRLLKTRAPETSGPRTAVAVLPFRNLNADSSYAYFAGGLHDELLTQLAKVASLRVVGRTSVRGYEETSKPLRQVGQELGAGSIVEASVQVVGKRLRVNVQLLDAVTQKDLWAESYDRTLDDAFAVQSDIAQRIVAAVGATLTNAEAGAIAAAPTRNAAAYDFYLQGVAYDRRPGFLRENLLIAQQLYERALALDSSFALAYAALSQVDFEMYGLRYDHSVTRLAEAQREAGMALRLAPDLPQAHLAVGLARYLTRGEYPEALAEFNLGLRGAPNDAELLAWIGRAQRSLGDWDSALVAFDHAQKLDPRDADLFQSIGDTYHFLRRYREAIDAYRHELVFAPDLVQPRLSIAWSYALWKGDLDTLRGVFQNLPLNGDPGGGGDPIEEQRLSLLMWERRPDSLLSLLRVILPVADTSARASSSRAFWAAQAHTLRGDTAAARAAYASSAALLDGLERSHPEDAQVRFRRGLALAALGRRSDARREVEWLERSDLHNENRFDTGWGDWRARLLIRLGETDAAFGLLEKLLAGPSLFSVHELRLDLDFDPIRNDPRYHALMRKYASSGS
jgi:TolB-like protein/DNA-binding SARP family transcriptional activator